jgi:hypothetical protein
MPNGLPNGMGENAKKMCITFSLAASQPFISSGLPGLTLGGSKSNLASSSTRHGRSLYRVEAGSVAKMTDPVAPYEIPASSAASADETAATDGIGAPPTRLLDPLDGSSRAASIPESAAPHGAGLFFTIRPMLEGSVLENAPAPAAARCAHQFKHLHQMQPFVWCRQLPFFSYALLAFTIFMTSMLIFANVCTSQWYHFLYTAPWIFFILCELTLGDRELLRVLFQLFDTWFLLINLLIMYICVIIAEFTKDPASPSIFPWATSLQHEQVRTFCR